MTTQQDAVQSLIDATEATEGGNTPIVELEDAAASTETSATWESPVAESVGEAVTETETTDTPSTTEPTPPPPGFVATPLTTPERERLSYLEEQSGAFDQLREAQQLEQETQADIQRHQSLGFDDQTAQYMAGLQRTERIRSRNQLQQIQQSTLLERAKQNAANIIGAELGVSPNELIDLPSPDAMKKYGKSLQDNQRLEQRISAIEKGQVDEQHFAGGAAAGSGSLEGEALEQAIGNGTVELTPERMHKLQDFHKSQRHGG